VAGESPFLGSGGQIEESGHVREFGVQGREPMPSRSQYASAKPQPVPVVTVNTGGGSFSAGGTLYFAIQARTRGGWTLVSSLVTATYAAGDSITIQVPTTARGTGDDIRRWEILASATNSASTLKSVAWIEGYQIDQTTLTTLPASIVLSRNSHIGLSQSVATPASLPSGSDLMHGMVRTVTSLASFFRYNNRSAKTVNNTTVLSAATGRWEKVGNDSTYILDRTLTPGGCDRDIRSIPDADVDLPDYAANGAPGIPVNMVWYHDEGNGVSLPQGTRFTLAVLVNEANKSSLFRGKIKLIFRGFVNLSDGTIDTSDGQGGTMLGVNEIISFTPEKNGLVLQKALPQGSGYLVSVYPEFNAWELRNEIGISSLIRIFLYPFSQSGNYSEAGNFLGDVIYSDGGRLRVVPGAALSVTTMDGGAMVASYSFLNNPVTPVGGLTANTGNQQIAFNGDGAIFLRAGAIPSSEAIRAIVSTVSGQGTLASFSNVQTIAGSTGQLQVTIPYPSTADGVGTIRADYPDSQLASYTSSSVTFNPPTVYIYVENQTTNEIKRFSQSVVAGTGQVFAISDWSAGTTVASIPAEAAANHGLFVPGTASVTPTNTGGSLPAGNYRVRSAFYFDGNQVSRIDHGSPPALPVLEKGVSNLLNTAVPYSSLTSGFAQPAIDGTITIAVADNRSMAVGGTVVINSTANQLQGAYAVTAKTGTTQATLKRLYTDGDVATGETVLNNSFVVSSGVSSGISPFGLQFNFNSSTSTSPPSGEFRLNNASPASATAIYVSETDRNNAAIAAVLGAIPNGSTILISQANNPANYAYYSMSAQADNGTNRTLTVTHLASNGTFSGTVVLSWSPKGDPGSSAASTTPGFALRYTFSSSTSSTSLTAGQFRLNNASFSGANTAFLSATDRNSKSISQIIFDLMVPPAYLFIVSESDSSVYAYYSITASSLSGFYTLTLTHMASNGVFSNTNNISLTIAGGGSGVQDYSAVMPKNAITPQTPKSLFIQTISGQFGSLPRETIWFANGGTTSASWIPVSGTPIRTTAAGNPNGEVTADYRGQILIDYTGTGYGTTSATMYIAGDGGASIWFAV